MLKLARLHVHAYAESTAGRGVLLEAEATRDDVDESTNPFVLAWLLLQLAGEINQEIARQARALNLQP